MALRQSTAKSLFAITLFSRWQEDSSPTWTTFVMWTAVMSIRWCATCAKISTSPRACWTATTSSAPAVYAAGPMTAVSAAPSVGKTWPLWRCLGTPCVIRLQSVVWVTIQGNMSKLYSFNGKKSPSSFKGLNSFRSSNGWFNSRVLALHGMSDVAYHTSRHPNRMKIENPESKDWLFSWMWMKTSHSLCHKSTWTYAWQWAVLFFSHSEWRAKFLPPRLQFKASFQEKADQ